MIPYRDENPTVRTAYVTFAIVGLNILVWLLVQGAGSPRIWRLRRYVAVAKP